MQAIVDEAHTHERKVAAHAHGTDGIKRAILAGVDSIEHASYLDREAGEAQRQSFTLAVEMGAKVVFATDSGVYPHGDNGKQFARAVRFGMTPEQALMSATSLSAELLGWQDQVGVIETGLYADLIAVHGNPLQDIREMEDVDFVMKGGVIYKQK